MANVVNYAPQSLLKKNFTNDPKSTKVEKVFSHESFPLYGSIMSPLLLARVHSNFV